MFQSLYFQSTLTIVIYNILIVQCDNYVLINKKLKVI